MVGGRALQKSPNHEQARSLCAKSGRTRRAVIRRGTNRQKSRTCLGVVRRGITINKGWPRLTGAHEPLWASPDCPGALPQQSLHLGVVDRPEVRVVDANGEERVGRQ
jgi:hypothetical protein